MFEQYMRMISDILKKHQRGGMVALTAMLISLFASCIPQKSIILLQDRNDDGQTVFEGLDKITDNYMLQPNDYLYINVASSEPKLAADFNPISSMTSSTSASASLRYFNYMIDDSMKIDFPVTGPIDLTGCNLSEAKRRIAAAISDKLTGFTLTVKLASNSFTILGEVSRQGHYTMDRDQITILDAIAQAGGFSTFAKRKEVKLLRKGAGGSITEYKIDFTDDAVLNSELYYVYPNDVIYVRPMGIKMFGFGETFSLSLLSSLLTLYLLILSI